MLLVYFTQKVVGLPANRPLFDFLTKSGKSGRFSGRATTFSFFPKVVARATKRPLRAGHPKSGRFAGKTTTFWQKVAKSGRFAGKTTTLGVGLALCRHYCCYETLVLSYCCYETLVLCYCCYGILVLLCYCVITVQQCYAVNAVRQLSLSTRNRTP